MHDYTGEISLQGLVDALGEIPQAEFGLERVSPFLAGLKLEPKSVKPFVHFQEGRYTRNLVFRNDLFEVLLLCWDKGQVTPVHNHKGQLGWMIIHEGDLSVVNYRRMGCSGQCHKDRRWSVMMVDRVLRAETGMLCHVRDGEQVHQIRNDDRFSSPAISLHIYSRPIDTCVIYDTKRNECTDKSLSNYSEYGQIIVP